MDSSDFESLSELESLEQIKDWSLRFEKALIEIENDLYLKLECNLDIYLAIDFYDLILHAYPEENIFFQKDKNEGIRNAISREALFNVLGSIYEQPMILLPPYL